MTDLLLGVGLLAIFAGVVVLTVHQARHGKSKDTSSGLAGVLAEFDRTVRPSVQHVHEVKDQAKKRADDVGGE